MKQKKLIFNFFVIRNWKKLTDNRKRAKILADNRKSHHPIETLIQVQRGSGPEYFRPSGLGQESLKAFFKLILLNSAFVKILKCIC